VWQFAHRPVNIPAPGITTANEVVLTNLPS
jgi:hypothetical protein